VKHSEEPETRLYELGKQLAQLLPSFENVPIGQREQPVEEAEL